MRQKQTMPASSAEEAIKDIRRATRRHWSAEDKIRIVLEGLRGEDSISELCRREGIAASQYYAWSKEFLEAGKRRLAGDTALLRVLARNQVLVRTRRGPDSRTDRESTDAPIHVRDPACQPRGASPSTWCKHKNCR